MEKTCADKKLVSMNTTDKNNFKSERTSVDEMGVSAKPFSNSIISDFEMAEIQMEMPEPKITKTKFIEHVNMDVVRYFKSLKKQELIKLVWGSIKDDRVDQHGKTLTKDEYVSYFNKVLDVYYKTDGELIRNYKYAKVKDRSHI